MPSARPSTSNVGPQVVNPPGATPVCTSRHSVDTPPSVAARVTDQDASRSFVDPDGPLTDGAAGATLSTVNGSDSTDALRLPAASTARTSNR